jgi:tRNA threonylcarbamoyladenosine biosynthesis protein TsaB
MSGAGARVPGRPVLAIDTATTRAVVALGAPDGSLLTADAWDAGHRHAEELVARIAALLPAAGLVRPGPGSLAGIIVGSGPGGFTGLRVGLATARGIARAAGVPIVGIPIGDALAAAARSVEGLPPAVPVVILLPAGPTGRILVSDGRAVLVAAGDEPGHAPDAILVAVDLDGRAPADAVARGAAALERLPATLLGLGTARLRAGFDDRATLAPVYVTPPRGVATAAGEVAWLPARP